MKMKIPTTGREGIQKILSFLPVIYGRKLAKDKEFFEMTIEEKGEVVQLWIMKKGILMERPMKGEWITGPTFI